MQFPLLPDCNDMAFMPVILHAKGAAGKRATPVNSSGTTISHSPFTPCPLDAESGYGKLRAGREETFVVEKTHVWYKESGK
jgi:hypothetical protein